ncbi:hypothetical protein CROQUDRAFT_26301, partial [Cronartium quercuum f. sp. fusiforme G11]
KPCTIFVDSSGVALSSILTQPNSASRQQPVAYFSCKLTPSECKWQIHDQELGAIMATFLEWCSWLAGTSFYPPNWESHTDHANLCYFMNACVLAPCQACWASLPSMYNFEILHTPGKLN